MGKFLLVKRIWRDVFDWLFYVTNKGVFFDSMHKGWLFFLSRAVKKNVVINDPFTRRFGLVAWDETPVLKFLKVWRESIPPYSTQNPASEVSDLDPETIFYQNRFSWFMNSPTEQNNLQIRLQEILAWIAKFRAQDPAASMDAYSCSQRLVHWTYLLAECEYHQINLEPNLKNEICEVMKFQLKHLSQNLEYRGASTNNHLSNNGRALYIAGVFLQDGPSVELGRKIVTTEINRVFNKTGFIRERSSHYQFIITLRFVECWIFAKDWKDLEFKESLDETVMRAVKACLFLCQCMNPTFSIGDICPDVIPAMTPDLKSVSLKIWGADFVNRIETYRDLGREEGYAILRNTEATLLAMTSESGTRASYSHGHADDASFLFWVGQQALVIDCGRSAYGEDRFGRAGQSVVSHSTVTCNDRSLTRIHAINSLPDLFPLEPTIPSNYILSHSNNEVLMEHHGFEWMRPTTQFFRLITLHENKLEICDEWKGAGKRNVRAYFPLHPNIHTEASEDNIKLIWQDYTAEIRVKDTGKWEIHRGGDDLVPLGWYSPQYGIKVPTALLVYSCEIELPHKLNFTLNWKRNEPCAA